MRTIGMVGGLSWVSTAEYYRLANREVASRLGGLHSAHLVLESVDLAEVEALKRADRWDEVGALLAAAAARVEAAGADLVLLCTNTMHHVADAVEAALTVPFVHIADTTAHAVRAAGLGRVGLLGTAFTMEQAFYRDRVAAHGIDVLVPDGRGRADVSRIVYDELCLDVVREASRRRYLEVVDDLVARGAEGVLLGCTEIELLVPDGSLAVPTFPTAALHVRRAVDLALAEDPLSS